MPYTNVTDLSLFGSGGGSTPGPTPSTVQTSSVIVSSPTRESYLGNETAAAHQNDINIENADKLKNLPQESMILTNKTIDADNNIITNLEPEKSIKTGYLVNDLRGFAKIYIWETSVPGEVGTYVATKTLDISDDVEVYQITYDSEFNVLNAVLLTPGIGSITRQQDTSLLLTVSTGTKILTYSRYTDGDQYYPLGNKKIATIEGIIEYVKQHSSETEQQIFIDVNALPVADINENVFYRLSSTHAYCNDIELLQNSVVFYKINEDSGIPITVYSDHLDIGGTQFAWRQEDMGETYHDFVNATLISNIEMSGFVEPTTQASMDFFTANRAQDNSIIAGPPADYNTQSSTELMYYKNNEWHVVSSEGGDVSIYLKKDDVDNQTTTINSNDKLQANAIIEVTTLPTTDILEKSIYKDASDHNKLKYYNNGQWHELGADAIEYKDLLNHPAINANSINQGINYTSHDLDLIGVSDIKTGDATVDDKGVNIILKSAPSDANNDTIIDDTLPYATNRTFSNNYVSTELNNIKLQLTGNLKIDNTKTELPANPEINTMYLIPIAGTHNYTKYIVDSLGNVINAGTTEMDLTDVLRMTDVDGKTTIINANDKLQANAIIEVTTLPTTDISQTSIYKDNSDSGKLKYYNNNAWKGLGGGIETVVSLPTENIDMSSLYKNTSNNDVLAYNTDGTANGWRNLTGIGIQDIKQKTYRVSTNIALAGNGANSWSITTTIGADEEYASCTVSTEGFVGIAYIHDNGISRSGTTITFRGWARNTESSAVNGQICVNFRTQKAVYAGNPVLMTEKELWSGSATTSGAFTMNDDWTKYSYLDIYCTNNPADSNRMVNRFYVSDLLSSTSSARIIVENGWDSTLRYVRIYQNSKTVLNIELTSETMLKIVGRIATQENDYITQLQNQCKIQAVTATKTSLISNEFYPSCFFVPSFGNPKQGVVHVRCGFRPETTVGNGSGIMYLTLGGKQIRAFNNEVGYCIANNNSTLPRFVQSDTTSNQIKCRDLSIGTGVFYWVHFSYWGYIVD